MKQPQTFHAERRLSPRFRVLKRGKAVDINKLSVIDCTVRDMSQGGARLTCYHAGFLPKEFLLDRTLRQVRVIWRRLNEVGVQYLAEAKDASRLRLWWPVRPPYLLRSAISGVWRSCCAGELPKGTRPVISPFIEHPYTACMGLAAGV